MPKVKGHWAQHRSVASLLKLGPKKKKGAVKSNTSMELHHVLFD